MRAPAHTRLAPIGLLFALQTACSEGDEEPSRSSSGTTGGVGASGAAVMGGATSAGAAPGGGTLPAGGTGAPGGSGTHSGGTMGGTGGAPSGGESATGGVDDTGGATGGSGATGGLTGTGGVVATGGNAATGGASTGGRGASGGASIGGRSASGGVSTGGRGATGGASAGGRAATGGAAGIGGTGGTGDEWYPCSADPSTYDATAIQSGSSWTVQNGGNTVYTGADMQAAIAAAFNSLSSGRNTKESVLIQGTGDVSADAQLRIPSYTIVNICGTLNVTGSTSQSDRSPLYARGATDIDIPHVTMTGSPQYGMFFRETSRIHIGQVDMRLSPDSSGIGIRIDNNPSAGGAYVTDVQIDYVYAESTGSHGIETYGVDGFTLRRLDGVNTGECGVLLNMSTNAEIGTVHCDNCGAGTGYAAFRMANRNGRINDAYPVNIHVGEVYARAGGRGVFCVSESGGAVIDNVDLGNTGSNAILLENCYNVTIAANAGRVEGPGDVRIAAREEFANSSDITFSNLTLIDTELNESPCGDNTVLSNNVFQGSADNGCG